MTFRVFGECWWNVVVYMGKEGQRWVVNGQININVTLDASETPFTRSRTRRPTERRRARERDGSGPR